VLIALTEQLGKGESLTDEQVSAAVADLTGDKESVEVKADFLTALAKKGETTEEITAFARTLRELAIAPPIDPATRALEILDVCGTGGDRLNTFNISTTVALVLAAAGVPVAKHGNRAITSQAGSADVLEALGIKIDLTPEQAAASLRDHHFAFFFAPNYHPAFKQIGPARRLCGERGQRTIFNFLGPLLNPARPTSQLVGVPRPELCQPISLVLGGLGVRNSMVVCGSINEKGGAPFLDELSILGVNLAFKRGTVITGGTLSPKSFPIQPATLADLAGSDKTANAEIVRRILHGEERGPKRDAVLLNCAAALKLAGKTDSFENGWKLAGELIDSCKTMHKLKELVAASRDLTG
jgi:anthranilate phosphoribosyltransferase